MTTTAAYAGSGSNTTQVGSSAWSNAGNATGAPDATCATAGTGSGGWGPLDFSVRLSVNVSGTATPSGTDQSAGTSLTSQGNNPPTNPLPLRTYNPGTTWLAGLTAAQVNDPLFGTFFSARATSGGTIFNYILLNGYTFSPAPSGTINTVKAVYSIDQESNMLSFVRGTLVDTPSKKKPIEDLILGEPVCGFWRNRVVEGTVKAKVFGQKFTVGIKGQGLPWVRASLSHRFYIGRGEYRTARFLKVGDTVFYRDGSGIRRVIIEEKDSIFKLEDVVTIEVSNTHNFFANGYAVHNIVVGSGGTVFMDACQLTIDYTGTIALQVDTNFRMETRAGLKSDQNLRDEAIAALRSDINLRAEVTGYESVAIGQGNLPLEITEAQTTNVNVADESLAGGKTDSNLGTETTALGSADRQLQDESTTTGQPADRVLPFETIEGESVYISAAELAMEITAGGSIDRNLPAEITSLESADPSIGLLQAEITQGQSREAVMPAEATAGGQRIYILPLETITLSGAQISLPDEMLGFESVQVMGFELPFELVAAQVIDFGMNSETILKLTAAGGLPAETTGGAVYELELPAELIGGDAQAQALAQMEFTTGSFAELLEYIESVGRLRADSTLNSEFQGTEFPPPCDRVLHVRRQPNAFGVEENRTFTAQLLDREFAAKENRIFVARGNRIFVIIKDCC